MIRLCKQIHSIGRRMKYTPLQFGNAVLAFVQAAIQYRFDKDSTTGFPGGPYEEYGRFALETVHDQVGDCECTAILCATLLSYLGFECALIRLVVTDKETGEKTGHMAVGLLA